MQVTRISLLVLSVLAMRASVALALDPPAVMQPSLLAGPPTQSQAPATPSLLEPSFDRAFEHVTGEVGIVAILRLELTPAQREIVIRIAEERMVAFNQVAKKSYGKLIALQGFEERLQGSAREKVSASIALLRAYLATRTIIHRESALDALAATNAFDDAQLSTARAMVTAYEKALRTELTLATPNLAGDELDRRVYLATLGDILKDNLELDAKMGSEEFDAFSSAIELTPVQEERVKMRFTPVAVQEFLGNRVPLLTRVRALLEVSRELTASQRKLAWKYIHEKERAVNDSRKDSRKDSAEDAMSVPAPAPMMSE